MTTQAQFAGAPRSARQLVAATFKLYGRYPVLFLVLAAGVIVPFELIALAATGTNDLSRAGASPAIQILLLFSNWVLISPLVSALYVNAVAQVRRGEEPRIGRVALQGLRVLPVVAAASIVAGLGIALGLVALIVPGVVLWLRWAVVAQTAAIEHKGWLPALRRSRQLSVGHYDHIFVFLIMVWAIVFVPVIAGKIAFGNHDTSAAAFLAGLLTHTIISSFTALALALLFYDLLARFESSTKTVKAPASSLDPWDYSDEDRPNGWYIDPEFPNRMWYWGEGDPPGWKGRIRTPRKIRRAWRAKQEARDVSKRPEEPIAK